MFGLFVLESALALLLSNQLPLKLVNEIFTVQFLDKLDAEVAACYSKVDLSYVHFYIFYKTSFMRRKIGFLSSSGTPNVNGIKSQCLH